MHSRVLLCVLLGFVQHAVVPAFVALLLYAHVHGTMTLADADTGIRVSLFIQLAIGTVAFVYLVVTLYVCCHKPNQIVPADTVQTTCKEKCNNKCKVSTIARTVQALVSGYVLLYRLPVHKQCRSSTEHRLGGETASCATHREHFWVTSMLLKICCVLIPFGLRVDQSEVIYHIDVDDGNDANAAEWLTRLLFSALVSAIAIVVWYKYEKQYLCNYTELYAQGTTDLFLYDYPMRILDISPVFLVSFFFSWTMLPRLFKSISDNFANTNYSLSIEFDFFISTFTLFTSWAPFFMVSVARSVDEGASPVKAHDLSARQVLRLQITAFLICLVYTAGYALGWKHIYDDEFGCVDKITSLTHNMLNHAISNVMLNTTDANAIQNQFDQFRLATQGNVAICSSPVFTRYRIAGLLWAVICPQLIYVLTSYCYAETQHADPIAAEFTEDATHETIPLSRVRV